MAVEANGTTGRRSQLVSPIIVGSIIVALVLSFAGYKVYQELQRRAANREFADVVDEIAGKIIELGKKTEPIVDEINRTWRDAIFSVYNKRDFNDAIVEVRGKHADQISQLQQLSQGISDRLKAIHPPEGKEAEFQRLKELYLLFNRYAEMAISPSGSLQTYSEQNSKLTVDIKSAIKELELMK
jgi:hypothetical protein